MELSPQRIRAPLQLPRIDNGRVGLHEYAQATGDTAAAAAADRTAEMYLEHRLFYSLGTGIPSKYRPHPPAAGQVINRRWLQLGYPNYWHYDILAVLMFLARIGRVDDLRAREALDLLERNADGMDCARPGRPCTGTSTAGNSTRSPSRSSRWCVNSCGSPKAATRSPAQG